MADTVASNIVYSGKRRHCVCLICSSDGTGETGVVKVDRSTLLNGAGQVPSSLAIASVRWNVQGFSSVTLLWHHNAADVVARRLTGNGYDNFEGFGFLHDTDTTNADAADGDIQLTSVGAVAGAIYDITLEVTY
jgi:hypothetical protein